MKRDYKLDTLLLVGIPMRALKFIQLIWEGHVSRENTQWGDQDEVSFMGIVMLTLSLICLLKKQRLSVLVLYPSP